MKGFTSIILGVIILSGCEHDQEISMFLKSYFFKDSDQGWKGDFADYPEGDSIAYELVIKHDTIPTGTSTKSTTKGLLVSGNNGNRDLFMFIKRKFTGLAPNATYEVLFNVKFSSNAPTEALGIGGAPGESVFLKVGATSDEPKKELNAGVYEMNIDKGNQEVEGEDMINIGHVGVAPTTTKYTSITRNNSSANNFIVTTNDTGEVWLIVGSDSAYKGTTTLYYTQIDVVFNRL